MGTYTSLSKAVIVLLLQATIATSENLRLEHHLEHFTKVRNPLAKDPTPRAEARNYIFDTFKSYELQAELQQFNTTISNDGVNKTVKGTNVIGIAEGPPGGPIILVGADYDTSLLPKSPLGDNGAGVGVMLEVARNYMSDIYNSREYVTTGTVIFVAFDINTREYDATASGNPGSYHFLHQWLWPYLQYKNASFNGAVILDSISVYNMEENSQIFPTNFKKVFPIAHSDIISHKSKGDFLALVSRKSERNSRLSQAFYDHYNKDKKARMFRLVDLTVEDGAAYHEDVIEMLNHQSHFQFWNFKPADKPMALPAILLTDTDIHRKPADDCGSSCTAITFLTKSKESFLEKTTAVLVQTLASLQTDGTVSAGMSMVPSFIILAFLVGLNKLLE